MKIKQGRVNQVCDEPIELDYTNYPQKTVKVPIKLETFTTVIWKFKTSLQL